MARRIHHLLLIIISIITFSYIFLMVLPVVADSSIYISELYFQQSHLSSRDKWIELYNPTPDSISLDSYSLSIGKSQYLLPLIKNNVTAVIEPYSYYIIQDNWGSEQHLLEQENIVINDYSGRVHWLSNVSDDPHITISLLKNNTVVQSIYYNTPQTLSLLSHPYSSLECTIVLCQISQNPYNQYYISPRGVTLPSISQEPPLTEEPEILPETDIVETTSPPAVQPTPERQLVTTPERQPEASTLPALEQAPEKISSKIPDYNTLETPKATPTFENSSIETKTNSVTSTRKDQLKSTTVSSPLLQSYSKEETLAPETYNHQTQEETILINSEVDNETKNVSSNILPNKLNNYYNSNSVVLLTLALLHTLYHINEKVHRFTINSIINHSISRLYLDKTKAR